MKSFFVALALIFYFICGIAPAFAVDANKVPKDVRAVYTRAHQCYYYSGQIAHGQAAGNTLSKKIDALKCGQVRCDYIHAMVKYKDDPTAHQFLMERYDNVFNEPYEISAQSCRDR